MSEPIFRTKGGRAAEAIRALQSGPRTTGELAKIMDIPGRRVHAYLTWAIGAGAVVILERGEQNRAGKRGRETIWGIGATPVRFGECHRPYRRPPPREQVSSGDALPVRRRIVPAMDAPRLVTVAPASVFDWRP